MIANKTNVSSAKSRYRDISTAALHIIAMLFMLMDHLWATLLPAQDWLTCVGRIISSRLRINIVMSWYFPSCRQSTAEIRRISVGTSGKEKCP